LSDGAGEKGQAERASRAMSRALILGLLKPQSGRVRLAGEDIAALPTPQIVRREIASVLEARRLFPDMTARENLLMGAYLRHEAAHVAEDFNRVLDRFPRLGNRLAAAMSAIGALLPYRQSPPSSLPDFRVAELLRGPRAVAANAECQAH
jgi:ABC-type branched-subunit amino acid transport system ATPase component